MWNALTVRLTTTKTNEYTERIAWSGPEREGNVAHTDFRVLKSVWVFFWLFEE